MGRQKVCKEGRYEKKKLKVNTQSFIPTVAMFLRFRDTLDT